MSLSSLTHDALDLNSVIHRSLQDSSTARAESYESDHKIDENISTAAAVHTHVADLPVIQTSDRLDVLDSDNIPVFPAEREAGDQATGSADQPRLLSIHSASQAATHDQENDKLKKGSSHTGKGADFFLVKIWQYVCMVSFRQHLPWLILIMLVRHLLFNPECQHIITWGENGRFLIIYDTEELMTEIKAKGVCKQKDYDSFARQLRIYRWGRVRADEAGSNPWPESAKVWKHPYLTKDSDLNEVANVTRNAPPKPNRSGTNVHKKEDAGAAAVQNQQEGGTAGHTGGSASESDVNGSAALGGRIHPGAASPATVQPQMTKKHALTQQGKKLTSTQQSSNANKAQTTLNGRRMSGPPIVPQPPPQILHIKALSDESLMRGLAQQASALIGIDLLSPALLTYLVGKRKEKMERRRRRAQKRQASAALGRSAGTDGMEIDLTREESRKRKASSVASRKEKRQRRQDDSMADDSASSESERSHPPSRFKLPTPAPFSANWKSRLTCNRRRVPSRYPCESETHTDSESDDSGREKMEDASTDDDEEFIPEFLPEMPVPPKPSQLPRKVAEENGTETEIVRLVERQLSTAAKSQPSQHAAIVVNAPATQSKMATSHNVASTSSMPVESTANVHQQDINGRHPDAVQMREVDGQSKLRVHGIQLGTSTEGESVREDAPQFQPPRSMNAGGEDFNQISQVKEGNAEITSDASTEVIGDASAVSTVEGDDKIVIARTAGTGDSMNATATEQGRSPAREPLTSEPPSTSIFSIDLPPFPFSFETMDLTPLPFDSIPSSSAESPMGDFYPSSGSLSHLNNSEGLSAHPSAASQEARAGERTSSPPLPAASMFEAALDQEVMKSALLGPAVPSISMQNAFRRQDSTLGSNGHIGTGSTSVPASEPANPFDGLDGVDTSAWLDFGNSKIETPEQVRQE